MLADLGGIKFVIVVSLMLCFTFGLCSTVDGCLPHLLSSVLTFDAFLILWFYFEFGLWPVFDCWLL